jgi:hypothetical protein
MGRIAATAVANRLNDPVPAGQDDGGGWDRGQADVAADQVKVIAGKEYDFAAAETLRPLIGERSVHLAVDNVVVRDEMVGCPEKGRAEFRRHPSGDAPRRRKLGIEENATAETGNPQNVRQGIHRLPPNLEFPSCHVASGS